MRLEEETLNEQNKGVHNNHRLTRSGGREEEKQGKRLVTEVPAGGQGNRAPPDAGECFKKFIRKNR